MTVGEPDFDTRRLGRHVTSLRKARGQTQDTLAERSKLAVDTIRRIEGGRFASRVDTLWKVTRGLDMSLTTLFAGYELNSVDATLERQVLELLAARPHSQARMALRVLRALFATLDRQDEFGSD